MSARNVKDPLYEVGYKYNRRVWIVDPQGNTTVITEEEHQNMIHKRGIHIRRQGRPVHY